MIAYFDGFVIGLAGLLLVLTLLPLSKLRYGFFRGPAFFRLQLFWVSAMLAIVSVTFLDLFGLAGVLVAIASVQLMYVVKFTPVWRRQSVDADADLRANADDHISLLAANVKKSNRDYDPLISLVRTHRPDILMAIEVDQLWITALEDGLDGIYPNWVKVPKETGYGMCVMSKLALSETEIREIVTEGVPSIRTAVTLRSGERLRLYVVHPEPPVINHDTIGRDSEIAHIGIEASQDPLPAVVTGDLNDVAWSSSTRSFQRISGLLDPRIGRGFYNTFNAFHWWARWPLDHLFHDPKFKLLMISRLDKIGSDHFPMLFSLALGAKPTPNTDITPLDSDEKTAVKDMITTEQKRPRGPIGDDWED